MSGDPKHAAPLCKACGRSMRGNYDRIGKMVYWAWRCPWFQCEKVGKLQKRKFVYEVGK